MSTSAKWSIDYNAISQSLQNAVKHYESDKLVGIIFGRSYEKRISCVVFVPSESNESLLSYIARIQSLFSPEVDAIGLAKLPTSPFTKFSDNISQLSLKFSVDDLRSVAKNARRLAAANPMVVIRNELPQRNPDLLAQVRVRLNTHIAVDTLLDAEVDASRLKTLWPNLDANGVELDNEAFFSSAKRYQKRPVKIFLNSKETDASDEILDSRVTVELDVMLDLPIDASVITFRQLWEKFLQRIITQLKYIFDKTNVLNRVSIRSFSPLGLGEVIHLVVPYVAEFEGEWRRQIHGLLNLRNTVPMFHDTQAISAVAAENEGRLVNPHEYVKYAPMSGGVCAVVRGFYAYYYYGQDGVDDRGWGCAYRAFQTVSSWLRHQRLTSRPVPTHNEIQQCLVDIGDKKPNFVGSNGWIGSLELSYCLETMFGISSRILPAKAGGESIVEHARAIVFHFENDGAPIMIGGGQYAYTIIGIDYDVRMGKCQYLVLDPHYIAESGNADIGQVVQGGQQA